MFRFSRKIAVRRLRDPQSEHSGPVSSSRFHRRQYAHLALLFSLISFPKSPARQRTGRDRQFGGRSVENPPGSKAQTISVSTCSAPCGISSYHLYPGLCRANVCFSMSMLRHSARFIP